MKREEWIKWKATELYKKPTRAEVDMKSLLRNAFRKYGIWFDTSVPLCGYIADFYCRSPHRKVAIEVDGSYHDGREEYDQKRNDILEQHGIMTIRVSNDAVQSTPEAVIARITAILNRQLPLKEIHNSAPSGA